jgi:hypothetical protein
MADDGVVRIGTQVDISNLQSGFARAAETVEEFNTRAKAAQDAYNKTAAIGTEAALALGQAFDVASANGATFVEAMETAVSAVQALAVSEQAEEAVLRTSTSARMAASAEMRIFGGNMQGSTRAAGAFLSSLPGLGAAMQAAFPIFGAIAVGEILVDLAGKVAKLSDEWLNLRSMQEASFKILEENEQAEIGFSNQMLAGLRQQRVLQAELSGGPKGRRDRGAAAGANFDIGQDQNDLETTKMQLAAVQQRMAELQKASQPHQVLSNGRMLTVMSDDARRAAVLLDEARSNAEKYEHQIDSIQQKLGTDTMTEHLRVLQSGEKSAGHPDQDQLKGIEGLFSQQNAARSATTGHGLIAGEGASFWAQYLTTFTAGSEQAKKVLDEFTKYQEDNHKKLEEAIKSSSKDENLAPPDEVTRSMAEISAEAAKNAASITRTGEAWHEYSDEVTKAQEIQTTASSNLQLASIASELALGQITHLSAAHQVAAIRAQEYAQKLKELNAELAELQANAKRDSVTGAVSDPKQAAQIQGVQNQISQTQGQAGVSGIQNQQAQVQAAMQPWETAIGKVNQDWLTAQNAMIMGTERVGLAFARMGQQLVVSVIDGFERMAIKSLEFEIQTTLAHQAANTAKITSDATAATVSQGLARESAIQQAMDSAHLAAVKTWAALAGIPVAGPVLAPIGAAAAYAGVMALAAFEDGTGFVPRTGIAMLHQGEAVIPAPTMNELRGSSVGDSSVSVHQENHFHGSSDSMIAAYIDKNPRKIAQAVQKHMRNQGRA